jgi:hypothetical protein
VQTECAGERTAFGLPERIAWRITPVSFSPAELDRLAIDRVFDEVGAAVSREIDHALKSEIARHLS